MAVSNDATDVSADPTQVEILPDTQISPHTNKPVPEGTDMKTFAARPIFWCDICSWKVTTITSILQHFNGKSHKAKLTARDSPDEHTNGSVVSEVKCEVDSDGKDVTSDLKCEVCDLNFSNVVGALQHFKGKRHEKASRKRALDEGNTVKQTQEPEVKKKKEQPAAKPTEVKSEMIKCEDCNIQFTNSAAAIPHFKGKKHTATIAKKIVAQQQARVSQRGTPMGGRGRGRGRGFGRGYTGNILHGNQPFTSGSLSDFQLLPSSDYRTSPLSNNYYSAGYKSDDRTNSSNFPAQLYDSY